MITLCAGNRYATVPNHNGAKARMCNTPETNLAPDFVKYVPTDKAAERKYTRSTIFQISIAQDCLSTQTRLSMGSVGAHACRRLESFAKLEYIIFYASQRVQSDRSRSDTDGKMEKQEPTRHKHESQCATAGTPA
jgi:hypothetical protein